VALTNKRKAFIAHYVKDFNATRAAKAAGFSEKTAYSQGQRLLKNVEVAESIKTHIEMSADEVKSRLADMARGDMADLMEISTTGFILQLMVDDGNGNKIINPKTKLIKKIKQKATTYLAKKEDDEDREIIETEIELYDAQAALALLGRYHKLFTDKTELTGKDGAPLEPITIVEVALPPEGTGDDK
jgi:phage terminase small subunit